MAEPSVEVDARPWRLAVPARPRAASALRSLWLVLHRWAGLTLAAFLIIAGATGVPLAFYDELHTATAAWTRVAPPHPDAQPLNAVALHAAVERAAPEARFDRVELNIRPGHAVVFYADSRSGSPLGYDEIAVDPYTGREVHRGTWGDITEGWHQLMPFIFRLHYTLALGEVGRITLGVAALIWTIDCFISFLLTLPHTRQRWLERWSKAWRIRSPAAGSFKHTFDLHRASGLWLWPILLVFAWSSVAFNLTGVYKPAMSAFGATDPRDSLPVRPAPEGVEHDWAGRLAHARALAAAVGSGEDFTIVAENGLSFRASADVYEYRFAASNDLSYERPQSRLYFDRTTGDIVALKRGKGDASANGMHEWLVALHIASIGGIAYQVFVALVGIFVVVVSVTGVLVWWRKRSARLLRAQMVRRAAGESRVV